MWQVNPRPRVCVCIPHNLHEFLQAGVQDTVLATLESWLADSSIARNVTTLLVAGNIYASEGDLSSGLKACHSGSSLEA